MKTRLTPLGSAFVLSALLTFSAFAQEIESNRVPVGETGKFEPFFDKTWKLPDIEKVK